MIYVTDTGSLAAGALRAFVAGVVAARMRRSCVRPSCTYYGTIVSGATHSFSSMRSLCASRGLLTRRVCAICARASSHTCGCTYTCPCNRFPKPTHTGMQHARLARSWREFGTTRVRRLRSRAVAHLCASLRYVFLTATLARSGPGKRRKMT